MVVEAYLHGVSPRKVDDLVRALGADTGISKSEASRICADLDAEVSSSRDRSLAEQAFPYVFLDATHCKTRVNRRVASRPSSLPTAWPLMGTGRCSGSPSAIRRTAPSGRRSCARWRPAGGRHPAGISDAHTGLKAAIGAVLIGAAQQRCRVHFSALRVRPRPEGQRRDGRRRISHRLAQPDAEHLRSQLDVVIGRQFPRAEAMLRDAAEDLLAFTSFPVARVEKIRSTNGVGAAERGPVRS